jgi:hypothetical protein
LIRGDHLMRQKLTLLLACACGLVGALTASGQLKAEIGPEPEPTTAAPEWSGTDVEAEVPQWQLQRKIDAYRHETWRWQRVMGHPVTRRLRNPPVEPDEKIAAWKRIAARTRARAQNPPHKRQWLCIHRYEGAWNDPNPPYYGGLQMDLSFQRAYASGLLRRKGTANRWTPLEQMWAAERAHRAGRGFYPWPNTARYCGLI